MKIAEVTATTNDVLAFLNSLPDDEVLTQTELAGKLNRSSESGQLRKSLARFVNNREKISLRGTHLWVYGSEIGIRNLRSQLKRTK